MMKTGRRDGAPSLFLALILALASTTADAAPARPLRVASLTVCGDEFLFRLADRAQIASVSAKADGPLAVFPQMAKGLPRNNRDIEELIGADVDLVLVEPGGSSQLVASLQRLGVKAVYLPASDDYRLEEIADGVRRVAAALGHPERAEPIIADMMARAAVLRTQQPPVAQRPIALYVRPEGGGSGSRTFMDTVISLAGFRNMQAMAGQKGWKRMNMEDVVQTPPQVFITSFFDTQANSLIAVRGRYPLLGKFNAPVFSVPGKFVTCASPSIVKAAELLRDQRLKMPPPRAAIQ